MKILSKSNYVYIYFDGTNNFLQQAKMSGLQIFKQDLYFGNAICCKQNFDENNNVSNQHIALQKYIVKPAETYQSIAKKFGTNAQELQIQNGTKRVFAGQQIFIKTKSEVNSDGV